jgi:glutamyl/glutaminyl-tRNA synthetase
VKWYKNRNTDLDRSIGIEEVIIESLQWLGLTWKEGDAGGENGPISNRTAGYLPSIVQH